MTATRTPWTDAELDAMGDMLSRGMRLADIAAKLNRPLTSVYGRAYSVGAGRASRAARNRGTYIGWVVCYHENGVDKRYRNVGSDGSDEREARELVRVMNRKHPHRLYWTEWWSTSSMLDNRGNAAYEAALEGVGEPGEEPAMEPEPVPEAKSAWTQGPPPREGDGYLLVRMHGGSVPRVVERAGVGLRDPHEDVMYLYSDVSEWMGIPN